jgi:hypothetical protein
LLQVIWFGSAVFAWKPQVPLPDETGAEQLPPNGWPVLVLFPGLRRGLFALCCDAPIWLTSTQFGPSLTVAAKLSCSVLKTGWWP